MFKNQNTLPWVYVLKGSVNWLSQQQELFSITDTRVWLELWNSCHHYAMRQKQMGGDSGSS